MIFTNTYNPEGHRGTLATRDASEDGITTDYVLPFGVKDLLQLYAIVVKHSHMSLIDVLSISSKDRLVNAILRPQVSNHLSKRSLRDISRSRDC